MTRPTFHEEGELDSEPWRTPGATFDVRMSWRLPEDSRLWAVFTVEVIQVKESLMRLQARIKELISLRSSVPPGRIDPIWFERVRSLIGRYVLLPFEAGKSTPLYLRVQTLTGEHSYFGVAPHERKKKSPQSGQDLESDKVA